VVVRAAVARLGGDDILVNAAARPNTGAVAGIDAFDEPDASVSIGRLVTASEVASVAAFVASPKSIAINGDAIAVSGGAVGPIYY